MLPLFLITYIMKQITFILLLILTSTISAQSIFEASRNGDLEKVKALYTLDNNAINTADSKGFTPLILAVYNNQPTIVAFLLEKESSINAKDASGNTALMGVCFKGYADIAKTLIENGANVIHSLDWSK